MFVGGVHPFYGSVIKNAKNILKRAPYYTDLKDVHRILLAHIKNGSIGVVFYLRPRTTISLSTEFKPNI